MSDLQSLFGQIQKNVTKVETSTDNRARWCEEYIAKAEERKKEDRRKGDKLKRLYNALYKGKHAQIKKSVSRSDVTTYTERCGTIRAANRHLHTEISFPIQATSSVVVNVSAPSLVEQHALFSFASNNAVQERTETTWMQKTFTFESITETILIPWNTSENPWRRGQKHMSQERKMITLMNKATIDNPLGKEFSALWYKESRYLKAFFKMIVARVLRHPKTARLYGEILHSAFRFVLEDRSKDEVCSQWMYDFFDVLANALALRCMDTEVDKPTIEASSKGGRRGRKPKKLGQDWTFEFTKGNRERMCGFVMMLAELQKHGVLCVSIGHSEYVDELLKAIRANLKNPHFRADCYSTTFIMRWLLKLKIKLQKKLYEQENGYTDDQDNYVARQRPKWTKDDSDVVQHCNHLKLLINKANWNNKLLDELDNCFDSEQFCEFDVESDDEESEDKFVKAVVTHVISAALADDGRNVGFIASYTVDVAESIIIFVDEFFDVNALLEYVLGFLVEQVVSKIQRLVESQSDGLRLKASVLITTMMRFINTVLNHHSLKNPKQLLNDFLNDPSCYEYLPLLRKYCYFDRKIQTVYFFKWIQEMKSRYGVKTQRSDATRMQSIFIANKSLTKHALTSTPIAEFRKMTSLRALFGKIDENLKTVEASTSEWTNRYEESVGKAKERKEEDLRNKEKLERIYNGLYNARRAQRTKSSKPSASTVHTEMSQSIQHPSASESVHITLPPLAHHSISVSLAACKSIDSNNEFTLSSQHASMEGSWSIIMVTSASTTSEAPILKPWRRSQQPWTRNRSSVSASLRKMISLMNKATVRKPLAAEFTALLIEDSYNIKILQDMLINRTLRYPETARLHVQILRSTIRHYLDTVKCEGEEDCNCHDVSSGIGNLLNRKGLFSCMDYLTVWLVLQWHPDFAVFNFQYAYEDIYKKAPPKDQYMLVAMVERAAELSRTNRQRMCGFLMMWAEIMKHGMLENVGPLDEILDSLQQRQHFPLLEDHAFDASFVIKWFLTLKKKFVDGLYESEESYDDDTDNYAARKTPKWKKDNSNVDVHFTRANFFVNQVTTGNTRLQELEKSFFDADEFFVPASDDGSDEEDEEYEEFDPYKAIFCLATHVSRAVLADQGRKAELMAEFAVTVAKQRFIDVYDKENEYLDPFLSYVCFETADFVKEVKEKVYEDSADLKREVSTVITSFMRFVGTIFNHDLERPKALLDGWLGNELVVDALNDLRDYEELHCEYLFKWLDRLKIQVSLDDVTLQ